MFEKFLLESRAFMKIENISFNNNNKIIAPADDM